MSHQQDPRVRDEFFEASDHRGSIVLMLPVVLALALGLLAFTWISISAHTLRGETALSPSSMANPAPLDTSSSQSISSLFSPEVRHWTDQILNWAEAYELDPNLIATVMQIESCGFSEARSGAGAAGLFQVMPYHFEEGEDLYDPQTNAHRGLRYLAGSLAKSNGDPVLALAGYNGGHGVISWLPEQWTAETKRYVQWGAGILSDITAGFSSSPTLEAWLNAGGASLCAKAANSIHNQ